MDKKDIRILLVDDEPDILELLEYHLYKEGYSTKTASDGEEALRIARNFEPHLIVLDLMMPKMDGIETCKMLRKDKLFENTIITFLTARNEEYSEVMALDSGADDFMNKPLKPSVFKSRINAMTRRLRKEQTDNFKQILGKLILDHEEICVIRENKKIQLAKKEFELLALLTNKPGKVYKRHKIMSKVWGSDVIVGDRTIDVHIRKLREKIGNDYIVTIKGIGYKFNIDG